jgi:MFS family permease
MKRELRHESKKDNIYFIPYNPLRVIIYIFRYPNLLLAAIVSMALHFNMYSLLTPIRYVVDPRFSLTEPIYGGLFYLAPGMGYIIGSFFGGKWSDYNVKKYMDKRGYRVPEDRLISMVLAYGFVLPATILIYGWCLEKEKGGMAVPIIMMFFGGLAQTICFPSINTYCVESMPQLKGDAIAGNYVVRFIAAAIGTAFVLDEIKEIGIGWTSTVSAAFLFCGFISCILLIRYGERLRN